MAFFITEALNQPPDALRFRCGDEHDDRSIDHEVDANQSRTRPQPVFEVTLQGNQDASPDDGSPEGSCASEHCHQCYEDRDVKTHGVFGFDALDVASME